MSNQQDLFAKDVYAKMAIRAMTEDLMSLVDHWEDLDNTVRITVDLDSIADGFARLGMMDVEQASENFRQYIEGSKAALSAFCGIDVDMDVYQGGMVDVSVSCNGRVARKMMNWERSENDG